MFFEKNTWYKIFRENIFTKITSSKITTKNNFYLILI